MSEQTPQTPAKVKMSDSLQLIYILYLCSSVTFGMTALLGVIWAYFERGAANEVATTHYTFLIQTFWKGAGLYLLCLLSILFLVGYLSILLWIVWFFWIVIRTLKGWGTLRKGLPIEKPGRWGF